MAVVAATVVVVDGAAVAVATAAVAVGVAVAVVTVVVVAVATVVATAVAEVTKKQALKKNDRPFFSHSYLEPLLCNGDSSFIIPLTSVFISTSPPLSFHPSIHPIEDLLTSQQYVFQK